MDSITLAVVAVILLLAAWYAYESATAAHMTGDTKAHPDVAPKFSKVITMRLSKGMQEALARGIHLNGGPELLARLNALPWPELYVQLRTSLHKFNSMKHRDSKKWTKAQENQFIANVLLDSIR
jgi:hypothetical protein